ncbi:hypothetical protein ABOM_006163 [Aspergillus bombycis]|uniref:Hydrophobin n=1 Tax=Aspergillus bombycis TaxID=109264 RepID=A0A1F7ZZF3_9EURO|nr:hypothetical protein ABOM_006163 [Aspergillus bombycis]OGM44842.1 hypothetical protein ABOM_006163 [Aspergillus bombycis]
MNPKRILLLLTTVALSTAVPFSQQQTPVSTPTKQSAHPAQSSMFAALASASPEANNGTCPDTHRSKQCCQSIDSIGDEITKGLGQLVPVLNGAKLSSILSLDCQAMSDTDPNENCTKDVMCCTGSPEDKGDSLARSCEPYDKAMKDMQEALEKNRQRPLEQAMSWAAMTSSMLAAASSSSVAAASSSPRLASSGVHAVPTGH